MFAYCGGNPINYADAFGTARRKATFAFLNKSGDPADSDDNILQKWEEKGVVYQSNGKGKGGKIVNSHLIRDGKEMTDYILAIKAHPQYKDDISGTIEGVAFEWALHNVLYDFFKLVGNKEWMEKAAHVDFGGTIYDDNRGPFGIGSTPMWAAYQMLSPSTAQQDLTTYLLGPDS